MYELMVEGTFDAAHQLIGHGGPCENLHGHSWKVQVYLSGSELNKLGILKDFKEIKTVLLSVTSGLDHTNLNTVAYFKKVNPTSENIAKYIFDRLSKKLESVSRVTVYESPITCASYVRGNT